MPGPPARGHGDSSLLPASLAGADSGRLAERGPGLPGTWVSGHLKREREREETGREGVRVHRTRCNLHGWARTYCFGFSA